ncbi:SART-1 family protein DOT2 [Linum grandiflorum]
MDKKYYEPRHDRREELVDPDDSPRAVDEDMGLNGVDKSSKHDGRDKDRKRSSREEDRDRDKDHRYKDRERSKKTSDDVSTDLDKEHLKYNERGKDRIKDVKGKDKDLDRDRSREKERERDKEKDRKDRAKDKERDRGRDTDKERGKEKNRDRERERPKDKEREKENEKLKDREKLRENDKDGDRKKGRDNAKEREAGQGKERSRERDGASKEDMQEDPEWSKDDKMLTSREYDGHNNVLASSFDGDQKNAERSSTGGQTSTSELRERIMKMKDERTIKLEAGSEILSWVNKTRKLEEKRNIARERAKRLSKNFEEQDNLVQGGSDDEEAAHNHTHDLAGVKVLDGLDKVMEGGAVVLTLKHQSILAYGDINNEVDMLENVEIGEQKRRDDAYKAAKKPAGIYSDKFNDDPMVEKKMLPQYDEPMDEQLKMLWFDKGVSAIAKRIVSSESDSSDVRSIVASNSESSTASQRILQRLGGGIRTNGVVKATQQTVEIVKSTNPYYTRAPSINANKSFSSKDRKKSSRAEDKDRDRDRDKDHRYKDRERSKKTSDDVSTDLDKEHLKYNERGKDRIKDVKGKDKDLNRDRSREKDRERDKEKDRKDRAKDKERDRGRDTDKERGKEKNRDRERERPKDKEREKENEKLKDREKVRENDKDGDRKKGRDNAKEREAGQAIETVELETFFEDSDDGRIEVTRFPDSEKSLIYQSPVCERLQIFLQSSDLYDPEDVLELIEGSELWLEKAILYRKLGQEALCATDSGSTLSGEMPLKLASETILRMLRARVHHHHQGKIVHNLSRAVYVDARLARWEERSRPVQINNETLCGSCHAHLGTKLFAM